MNTKVLFDGVHLGYNYGIARDSENFLKFAPQNTEILLYKNQRKLDIETKLETSFLKFNSDKYQFGALFGLKPHIEKNRYTHFFLPQITSILNLELNKKKIVRIHDLFPISNPEWFKSSAVYNFKLGLKRIRPDDIFICNSKYTEEKIKEYFGNSLLNTIVSYPETRMNNLRNCSKCAICNKNSSLKDFILMVGTIEPRKNYVNAIKAFLRAKTDMKLVIVGNKGWKADDYVYNEIKSNSKIIHLQNICNAGLSYLYLNCAVFLSYSLDEGFNMPLQEARNHNAKVIASYNSVHSEVHADFINWVDSRDIESLKEAIESPELWNNYFENNLNSHIDFTSVLKHF